VPEIVVVNKIDAADPLVVSRLLRQEPHAVAVSARTGDGLGALSAAVEAELPRPPVEVDVVVPYDRGDLVSQVHDTGEVLHVDHRAAGTHVRARVSQGLAAALERFESPGP
jgi:GTP-binding protein HflX